MKMDDPRLFDQRITEAVERLAAVEADMGKLVRDTIRNVEECATRVAALAKRVEHLEGIEGRLLTCPTIEAPARGEEERDG